MYRQHLQQQNEHKYFLHRGIYGKMKDYFHEILLNQTQNLAQSAIP